MTIKDENYVCIQGWMINKLNLKGNDLFVYAIIYGFTQSASCAYIGSLQYLADWCNSTKQGILKNLKHLIDMGYIHKEEWYSHNVKVVEYYTVDLDVVLNKVEQGIKQSLIGYSTEFNGGIKQSLINNIDNKQGDNKEDKIDRGVEEFIKSYNAVCTNLSTVRKVTDKRKKAIQKIIKHFTDSEIQTVLQKTNESDFLVGKNDRGWKADIDFILREDKFINILEGKYDNHKSIKSNKFSETDNMSSKKVTQEEIDNGYFTNETY